MDNTFIKKLKEKTNFTNTENGGIAYKSTLNKVYDLFALGGAYRNRTNDDCILLFKNAFNEDKILALKCLFYLRDCRGGQGERKFFRLCYNWLSKNYPDIAKKNFKLIPEYGRWDDLIYSTLGTPIEEEVIKFIKEQLFLDLNSKTPSLLAKWCPSENASSYETVKTAQYLRMKMNMSSKEYRKILSSLREKINIVERLMSSNKWEEIEFDKIPSKAGLIYRNAFAAKDIIREKYINFIRSKETRVNASTIYPYGLVKKALSLQDSFSTEREVLEKYWENLPDYLLEEPSKMICVVDTSASMMGTPINVAISLGMYCAERLGGDFKNKFISFSDKPQLITIEGKDFVDKVRNIHKTIFNLDTNLEAVFDLLLESAKKSRKEDIPQTIIIISDMEINSAFGFIDNTIENIQNRTMIEMEKIKEKWRRSRIKCPKLIYWNVNAKHDIILDRGSDVSFVSGFSPTLFETILSGKTGLDLMIHKLNNRRYSAIDI